MINSHRRAPLSRVLFAGLLLICFALPGHGQDRQQIAAIESLGKQEIAQRKARAAAAAEAEHQRRLEEATRLKQIYRQYLGQARRAALRVAEAKRRSLDADAVASARVKARDVIDTVDDQTKERVKTELDPIYAELEEAIVPTVEQMHAIDPRLAELRQELGRSVDLDWVDETAILYSICATAEHQEIIAGNVEHRDALSNDEAEGIDLTNRRRLVLGLNPLAIDVKLSESGRDHSKDMRNLKFFDHDSPVPGKTKFWDRAKNFGTTASGENIAYGYSTGTKAIMGWWYSPGHLKNMMNRGHKRIGLGQDQTHYTQLFGG